MPRHISVNSLTGTLWPSLSATIMNTQVVAAIQMPDSTGTVDMMTDPLFTGTLGAEIDLGTSGTTWATGTIALGPVTDLTRSALTTDVLDPDGGNNACKIEYVTGRMRNLLHTSKGNPFIVGETYNVNYWIMASGSSKTYRTMTTDAQSLDTGPVLTLTLDADVWTEVTMTQANAQGGVDIFLFGTYTQGGGDQFSDAGTYYIYSASCVGPYTITGSLLEPSFNVINMIDSTRAAPADGDIWFSGSELLLRSNGTTVRILTGTYP